MNSELKFLLNIKYLLILFNLGVLCWMNLIYNWHYEGSYKSIWSRKYKCNYKSCPVVFKLHAKELEANTICVVVEMEGIPNHVNRIEVLEPLKGILIKFIF